MYHPDTMYVLAKQRHEEDLRTAERERQIREAARARPSGAIDAVRFRDRLSRLFEAVFAPGGGTAGADA